MQGNNIFKKRYYELLEEIGDYCCQNIEFFEQNYRIVQCMGMNSEDIKIFYGCMNIYDVYGINYFQYYWNLKICAYGDYSNGIISGINDNSCFPKNYPEKELCELIDVLRFFSIKEYHGIPYAEFEAAYSKVYFLCIEAKEEEKKQSALRNQRNKENFIHNYFNYNSFSENEYTDEFLCVIEHCMSHKISVSEAMQMTQNYKPSPYVVVFMDDNRVVSIRKATRLFSCIERHSGRNNINNVYFQPISDQYIDDIVVDLLLHYELPIPETYPNYKNQKYATLKNAVSAYKMQYNLTKKQIMLAIENHNVRLIEIGFDRYLINKHELYLAINKDKK